MTRDILQTRLATPDDTHAIFDMYSELKQQQEYPAFRSNAFYRAVENVIEHTREAERLFVVTDMSDSPIGMGHLVQPFSISGNSRKKQELSHLYIDETHSEAFVAPVHLVDYAAHLALHSGSSRTIDNCTITLDKQNTNCLDIVAAHYPEVQYSSSTLRFKGDILHTMASRAVNQPYVVIGPASPDQDIVVAHHS